MITKGLKVGDTFEDGGNTYKVLKVVGENYESQLVKTGSVDFFRETKEEVKEEVKTDLSSIPYAQLKKMCADKGLDAKGSKSELIARLEG
jgi:hypothetical protein